MQLVTQTNQQNISVVSRSYPTTSTSKLGTVTP